MTFDENDITAFEKWVKPFYMRFGGDFLTLSDDERTSVAQDLRIVLAEINSETLSKMLVVQNWRPRQAAGYLVGFGKFAEHTDLIGENLLKTPQHALMYCFALVRLNTLKATEYLCQYVRKDLQLQYAQDFDAERLSVDFGLIALQFIDDRNGSKYAQEFYPDQWNAFVQTNLDFIGERSKALRDTLENGRWSVDSLARGRNYLEALILFAEQMVD